MAEDFQYSAKRMQLLFEQMKWMLEKQQLGISLDELTQRMELGAWEVRNLFQEYLRKDPVRFIQDAFSPSLVTIDQTQQISIFDVFDVEETERNSIPVQIELIDSPGEIRFTTFNHFLGKIFIASTEQGICQLTFQDSEDGFARLKKTFPNVLLIKVRTNLHEIAFEALCTYFSADRKPILPIPIRVKGTAFQLDVWRRLVELKRGGLVTCGTLAADLGDSKLSRAVGTAVGSNPVALLIPCQRVVQRSGKIGYLRWGVWRKQMILAIEK